MKKLALLMFATLILACGTEKPVVEELEPVIEAHIPTVASGEHLRLDIDLQIIVATVWDGQDDVDPEQINAGGIIFQFDEDLKMRKIDFLREGEAPPLGRYRSIGPCLTSCDINSHSRSGVTIRYRVRD